MLQGLVVHMSQWDLVSGRVQLRQPSSVHMTRLWHTRPSADCPSVGGTENASILYIPLFLRMLLGCRSTQLSVVTTSNCHLFMPVRDTPGKIKRINCKVCCLCCTMRILCATIITGLCMLDLRQTYGAAWVAQLEDSLVQRRSWVWVSSRVAFIEKGCSWTVFFCTRLGWTVHNNDCICKCVRVHAWGGHSDVFGIKCRYCSLKFAGQKRQFNHVPKRLPTLPLCTLGRPNTPSGWIHTSWQRSAIIKFKKHKEKRRRRRSQFSRASVGDTCILHIANYSVTWLELWPPIPFAMYVHTRTH